MSLPEIPELFEIDPEIDSNPEYSIAIIKDGYVYQVMNTDGQTAALLLSNPTFVQVDRNLVAVADVYDEASQTFSKQ